MGKYEQLNAILHRSYLAASSVQVCLYDDRLEMSSPGGLKRGLRLEDALAGQSEIRNKALALAFQYMKLIENWGTGLRRVRREVTEFGLRDPGFVVDDSMFRVNIYRMSLEQFGEKLHPATAPDNKPISDKTNSGEPANEQIAESAFSATLCTQKRKFRGQNRPKTSEIAYSATLSTQKRNFPHLRANNKAPRRRGNACGAV